MNLNMIISAVYYLIQHINTTDSCCCALSLAFTANLLLTHGANFPVGETLGVQRSPVKVVCDQHTFPMMIHMFLIR